MASSTKIPVARPRLPRLAAVAPYIERIDAARQYGNFGPLCQELEARLAQRFALPAGGVTTVANATVGLKLALAAAGARPGSVCLAPSWTFSASVHAVVEAGMVPCFLDVDRNGLMSPQAAREALRNAGAEVGAVMPVSVYGQPVPTAEWDRFAEETGVAVVIDAAPGFDAATAGRVLNVVSLHATKVLGVGEGGFVMSSDSERVAQVRQRSNFGFLGSREAQIPATNGKLSEYAAALGLAGLDEWAARREAFRAVAMRYREALSGLAGVSLPEGWGDVWQSTTCVAEFEGPAAPLAEALGRAGVETRAWWGRGMHADRAFAGYPRLALPTTARLAATTLGLPFYVDMQAAEVDAVCAVLREELARCS